jgi:hypothetical protein
MKKYHQKYIGAFGLTFAIYGWQRCNGGGRLRLPMNFWKKVLLIGISRNTKSLKVLYSRVLDFDIELLGDNLDDYNNRILKLENYANRKTKNSS